MMFLFKLTLRLFLFLLFLVLLYEIALTNYDYFKNTQDLNLQNSLQAIVKNSNDALSYSIGLISERNFSQFKLFSIFSWIFQQKVYWIVLVLVLLICYYEYQTRDTKTHIQASSRIPLKQFHTESTKRTDQAVSKLMKSQKYQQYLAKKLEKGKKAVIDVDEQDEEFTKDWEQNQKKIFD